MRVSSRWKPLGTRLARNTSKEDTSMLETIAVLLLLFWALGLVTSYTMSGLIHILLVAAVVVVLVRVIQGRRPI
jgi:Flp pilus assembly protein TadB